jgi:hypothetical protein
MAWASVAQKRRSTSRSVSRILVPWCFMAPPSRIVATDFDNAYGTSRSTNQVL